MTALKRQFKRLQPVHEMRRDAENKSLGAKKVKRTAMGEKRKWLIKVA